ncbi:alanyl-tRNA editing protein [Mesorhizobium sp. YIM 152430]|uniref:alanyl-tRNA editing protein n=1 Tax=Mesorhizobium sp. YIM 152430 TaxID=3031761 RepID=UPI0023DA5530|nr:alanyl-tRNA editing protein [Mesorhizobium sp. YIM 152430]MDF1601541.1 alanyl-tRNA editing protein [Mesorhizobium sp. YIM 152430]
MMAVTEALFREDAYLRETEAKVLGVNDRGGVLFDRTIFYATSGGQPGDTGRIVRANGETVEIAGTITGETKDEIIHLPAPNQPVFEAGETVTLRIDWDRRFNLMRMHTACHLLTVICPYPITGAAVSEEDSRVDFDLPDAGFTKEEVTARLRELIAADHPVSTRWIGDDELAANPSLVKSKNVRPPTGSGRIRLVLIGENGTIDSQPCGGTHVRSLGEIGAIHVGKIEKKGRENRRFRLRFGPLPA